MCSHHKVLTVLSIKINVFHMTSVYPVTLFHLVIICWKVYCSMKILLFLPWTSLRFRLPRYCSGWLRCWATFCTSQSTWTSTVDWFLWYCSGTRMLLPSLGLPLWLGFLETALGGFRCLGFCSSLGSFLQQIFYSQVCSIRLCLWVQPKQKMVKIKL